MMNLHFCVAVMTLLGSSAFACDQNEAMSCLTENFHTLQSTDPKEPGEMCRLLEDRKTSCAERLSNCPDDKLTSYINLENTMSFSCHIHHSLQSVWKEDARVKRQICNSYTRAAILACTQRYMSDAYSNLEDLSYICRLTKNFIQNCLKANTEGCPEIYDEAVSLKRAELNKLESICGDMCISRTAPCNGLHHIAPRRRPSYRIHHAASTTRSPRVHHVNNAASRRPPPPMHRLNVHNAASPTTFYQLQLGAVFIYSLLHFQ